MAKLRLKIYIRPNNKGAMVQSIPIKRLEKLAKRKRRSWELKDGWLILDAFG